jgi:hypothetical protein
VRYLLSIQHETGLMGCIDAAAWGRTNGTLSALITEEVSVFFLIVLTLIKYIPSPLSMGPCSDGI